MIINGKRMVLPLAGCISTSVGIPNIYLIRLEDIGSGSSSVNDHPQLQVYASDSDPIFKAIPLHLKAASGSFFAIGVVFFLLIQWVKKGGKSTSKIQIYSKLFKLLSWLGVGLGAASAISVTQISAALQYWSFQVANSRITASAGITIQVLQWIAIGFSATFVYAITSMLQYSGNGPILPAPPGLAPPAVFLPGLPPPGPPPPGLPPHPPGF
ncbi:hypothetical protein EJ08DRAFT_659348 [Tothia fuscella]|uniref:Uncharacterized protein n=1 Tax=Tothia fuscella TaxID=1048955 RepID=A0A9P4U0J3_9PEZI|nr:hypothetical protein EJ08DRAFT_659348 [Tothia fuscella]